MIIFIKENNHIYIAYLTIEINETETLILYNNYYHFFFLDICYYFFFFSSNPCIFSNIENNKETAFFIKLKIWRGKLTCHRKYAWCSTE